MFSSVQLEIISSSDSYKNFLPTNEFSNFDCFFAINVRLTENCSDAEFSIVKANIFL